MNQNNIMYYRAGEAFSPEEFGGQLARLVSEIKSEEKKKRVLYLCIGSDRSTGDSLGPLIGHMLTRAEGDRPAVLGTLHRPVHAVNLEQAIMKIQNDYADAVVVAIDASVGSRDHVGYITLSKGAIKPGLGVSKDLTAVAHISSSGRGGREGRFEALSLEKTRLSGVMELAECICKGIETVGVLSKTFLPPQTENDSLRIRTVV